MKVKKQKQQTNRQKNNGSSYSRTVLEKKIKKKNAPKIQVNL